MGRPAFVCKIDKTGGRFYLLGLMHGHWDIRPEEKDDIVDMDAFGP